MRRLGMTPDQKELLLSAALPAGVAALGMYLSIPNVTPTPLTTTVVEYFPIPEVKILPALNNWEWPIRERFREVEEEEETRDEPIARPEPKHEPRRRCRRWRCR